MKSGCNLMRKGMKLLAAILAAVTVCVMSVSAFAAAPVATTTTTYSGNDVTVTTNVTGAVANEEVAYMVKDTAATELNNETIYYIDQKTANASGALDTPFSFTMAKSKITGIASSTVMVGTSSTAAGDFGYTVGGETTSVIKLASCTVTYTVTGGGRVILAQAALGDVNAGGETAATKRDTISFWVIPEAGKKLATVNDDEVTLTNGVYTHEVTGDATLAFVFAADEAVATVVPSGDATIEVAGEKPTASLTAKATGNFTEAGIKINGVKYPALGFGLDGAYTVTVIETVEEGATPTITADAEIVAYVE